jgi:hypothetical protein
MLKIAGIAAIVAVLLATAAYTKPSRAELQTAAVDYADRNSFLGAVAARVTGMFGNDSFDDYIVFSRYRVYVGKTAKVDCYGAFGRTTCGMPEPPERSAEE